MRRIREIFDPPLSGYRGFVPAAERSQGERSFPMSEAAARAVRVIRDLRLHMRMGCAGGDPTVVWCLLEKRDRGNSLIFRGSGKGHLPTARAGALFEALEHYTCDHVAARPDVADITLCATDELATSRLAADASIALLSSFPDQRIACRRYISLVDGGHAMGPLFLHSPGYVAAAGKSFRDSVGDYFDYLPLLRYSSSNGCAIGATPVEAVVHALNEAVESDAFSLFLIRAFLGSGHQFLLLDRATLPAELQVLAASVEERLRSTVQFLDITTDLGIPTALAYAPPAGSGVPRYGLGTSLSSRHAIYRACTELLEVALAGDAPTGAEEHRSVLRCLSEYPELQECAAMDLHDRLAGATLRAFADEKAPDEPADHIEQLVERLTVNGFDPHVALVAGLTEGVTTCHVIVPGLERFLIVTHGQPQPPGPRGLAQLSG